MDPGNMSMWHYWATILKSTLINKDLSAWSEILAKLSQGYIPWLLFKNHVHTCAAKMRPTSVRCYNLHFTGMFFGSPAFGAIADKYGRRVALITGASFLLYFGLLTSVAPTFQWILFLRFCCGFYIGAVPQVITLMAEYLPSKHRGKGCMM